MQHYINDRKEGHCMNIKKLERKIFSHHMDTVSPWVIPITLHTITELTYKHDPHIQEEAKLTTVIEEYLSEQAKNAPPHAPLVIALRLTEQNAESGALAEKIIRHHFSSVLLNELDRKRREVRRWRFNLIVGFIFLALCIAISQFFGTMPVNDFTQFFKESFSIIGWVALWEPVSYFLYGWREDNSDIIAALRLSHAQTTILT